ncbi:MAG TPA: VCBS repeat-containing protein, partial [Candidatus Limnocylindrales bacterium]|nr:VCBS repeat-containing protein [Candidatus Limnocylindrales bacterium]
MACAILICAFTALSLPAVSAEYPRRIAIAPFASLAKEDIQQTVSVLPRLLSSRLMALAGAEVLLLPAGEKSAEDAAKGAGLSLLLKGSVAKLGSGYSIDVTVTEVATGKVAGAFFASAATEDEIIPRLGDLATEISEKLFGVKAVVRAYAPPPAAQLPPSSPAVPPPVAPAGGPSPVPTPGQVPAPVPAPPGTAALQDTGKEWVPSSLKKVSESGMIADELHGIVSGDVDSEGNAEVIAYGKKGIYLYRVSGTEILPKSRISGGLPGQLLNVEAVDLDLDGVKEIVVTGIDGDNLRSSVWKKKGEGYEKIGDRIPYFLVFLPDWQGRKVVAGQQAGS